MAKQFKSVPQNKKGAGRTSSPRTVSRFTRSMRVSYLASLCSGGQNLAALSAAAGENLAAVSSSHSLAEAMNLGTVALGGLIGTLHSVHLLYDETLCSAASFDRSNT